MSTAIDSNVLIALWKEDDTLNTQVRSALDTALGRGGLVIAAPVFAELLAAPSRTESFLIPSVRKQVSPWTGTSTKPPGAGRVASNEPLSQPSSSRNGNSVSK
jgi:predicted nucleic acid-binding protein